MSHEGEFKTKKNKLLDCGWGPSRDRKGANYCL